jgi:hypothetical protein
MKSVILLVFASFMIVLAGCSSAVSTNPADYVGDYIFTPHMEVPQEFADALILNKDFSAIEVKYSAVSKQIVTKSVSWHLDRGTNEEVVMDGRAYPIEKHYSSIRLVVNGDLGQQYEKVR